MAESEICIASGKDKKMHTQNREETWEIKASRKLYWKIQAERNKEKEGGEKKEHVPASGFLPRGLQIQDRWVKLLKLSSGYLSNAEALPKCSDGV